MNHTDLYSVIDSTHVNNISPRFTGELDYVPYCKYDASNDQRCWQDFMILDNDPTTTGATLVPVTLDGNKMTVSVTTRQMDYYPLYLSIGNVFNTVHHAHHNAMVLIGFLAMPKSKSFATREHARTPAFHKFKRQLFHPSLTCILHSLHHPMKIPKTVLFGDNYYQCHCNTVIEEFELCKIWDTYGIVGDVVVNIHEMLSPDVFHLRYLVHIPGRTEAEKILNDIDGCIVAVAPFAGLWHFPQGQHFKQASTKRHGACCLGFLKFCYLICQNVITKQTLAEINDVLRCFHHFCKVFQNAGYYHYLIYQFGVLNGLCSSITKSKHVKMILINQRLDKLTAMHVYFEGHCMLNGACLSKAFENIGALAAELGVTEIPNILCHFLHLQLYPTDTCDPEDVPLQECPFLDGKIHIYNSAHLIFFVPSNLSGTYGMLHKYIYKSCPHHLDYGMHGLDVTCILCFFFSFKYQEKLFPWAVVHWFDHVIDGPDTATGMWIVHPSYHMHNHQNIAIIHIDTISHVAHFIPVFASHNINSRDIRPHHSYDIFHSFYVNKYADHHTFKIAF
ncbi:hypothetical protein EDC04DRAFT_2868768 [Pisolithus marmoratus]|nr:hypothetical protein EDC04DRAFT_2868768 [Pisolithus marmoratus]